ncbi:MAG: dihydroneopterin aldolase [Actinomycetota bacterium]|nr:dihydroneopterin aldolase [Actinomycetota bacterium]
MSEQGTDLIEVRGLKLRGHHGVTPEERENEQPIIVSLAARLDTRAASATDDLASTLDYEDAVTIVSKIVVGESFQLLETLADRIARAMLSNARVLDVWVRVSKPEVVLAEEVDEVAVEISRSRSDLGPYDLR